ncbi:hypothetical protein PAPHI01_0041 [Pancytospora philotis]|nr:hypothetical protein PAPHI01_0041 [Pancytospora philotis]
MSANSRSLRKLITRGVCSYTDGVDINEVNAALRPLGCEAVLWPDRSCLVVKDMAGSEELLPPWKEDTAVEAKRVFTRLAMCEPCSSYLIPQLEEEGWLEAAIDGGYVLSKRALVQFEEFLLGLNGRYRRCGLCKLLVDSEVYHESCKSLLIVDDAAGA